jgi:hypothetical protein
MKKHRVAAPIIAAILLLLPVLYVVSYLLLVVRRPVARPEITEYGQEVWVPRYYRAGRDRVHHFFGPLELVDRNLQPDAWDYTDWDEAVRRAASGNDESLP